MGDLHGSHSHSHHGHAHSHGSHAHGGGPFAASFGRPTKDIWWAAKSGDLSELQRLVNEDETLIYATDDDGSTPLHWAAYFDRLEVLEFLLARGGNTIVDVANHKEGQTPLHWACIGKSTRAVLRLAKCGADLDKGDNRGYNSLVHCAQYDHTIAAHFLVSKGVSVGCTDNEGHTPLHWAAYQKHEAMARLLLQLGADINAVDKEGLTPLHWAALKGHYPMVEFLVHHGARPAPTDLDGFTPEDLARQKNMVHTAELLKRSRNYDPASQMRYWRLWFILPWLIIPGGFVVLDLLPLWLAMLAIILSVYACYRLAGPYWLGKDTNNPFFMSVMLSSYALSTWYYFTTVYPLTSQSGTLTTFFIGVNMIWVVLYLWMLRSDPGKISRHPDALHRIYEMIGRGVHPVPQLCPTCMMGRPIRSKHCRSCDACVARMDHHCTWINNCVGVGNHVPFLFLLVLIILMHGIFAYFCYQVVTGGPADSGLWVVEAWWKRSAVGVALMAYHLFNGAWESYVLYQQIGCVLANITANEYLNASRYWYFRDGQNRVRNPFNRGLLANVLDFLKPKRDYYTLFTLLETELP